MKTISSLIFGLIIIAFIFSPFIKPGETVEIAKAKSVRTFYHKKDKLNDLVRFIKHSNVADTSFWYTTDRGGNVIQNIGGENNKWYMPRNMPFDTMMLDTFFKELNMSSIVRHDEENFISIVLFDMPHENQRTKIIWHESSVSPPIDSLREYKMNYTHNKLPWYLEIDRNWSLLALE
jgi:hypothetical protein